ncbi:hypothetical protein SRHO_G00252370 [Serrasalmus rhombeus]
MWSTLSAADGVLKSVQRGIHGVDQCERVVVPKELVPELLKNLHNTKTGGHLRVNKLKEKVRIRFFWPGWAHDVTEWCMKCELCAVYKSSGPEPRAPLHPIRATYPFERVGIDIVGPLPITPRENQYILVVADYFSKWCEAFALKNQEADTVARVVVEQFILRWGTPKSIHTDQGKKSALFREICDLLEIQKTRTTPYHPQSDGLVERLNRTVTTMLSMFVQSNQRNWDELLPYVMMAYRSSIQASTKFSPYCALFGREIVMPLDLLFNVEVNKPYVSVGGYVKELEGRLQSVHEAICRHQQEASRGQKQFYDLWGRPTFVAHYNRLKLCTVPSFSVGPRNGSLEQPGRVPGRGWDSSRGTDGVKGHSISPAWGTWYRNQGNVGRLEDAGKDTDGLLASTEGPNGVSGGQGGTQGLDISDTPGLSTLNPIGVGVPQTSPPRRARVPRASAWHKDYVVEL